MMMKRDAFSQFEYEGWQRVADKYESAWSNLTRQFIPHLLAATQVRPAALVLDVACGPGYVAEAARDLGALPSGVDFSPEMIRLAQARNPEIPFYTGDAQAFEFEDESFDAVVMNFGVLHLSDPKAAFAEARRVLRPGGHYGFTVWAGPEYSPGAKVIDQAVQAYATQNVDLPKGPDYFGYGDAKTCHRILTELGFDVSSLIFRTETVEWQVPSASFIFEAERDAGVRTAALLAAQTPEVLSLIQQRIESGLQPYANRDGFNVPFAAHVVAVRAA